MRRPLARERGAVSSLFPFWLLTLKSRMASCKLTLCYVTSKTPMAIQQHAYIDLFLKKIASLLPPSVHAHVTFLVVLIWELCALCWAYGMSLSHTNFFAFRGGALRAGEVGSDRHPSLAKIT